MRKPAAQRRIFLTGAALVVALARLSHATPAQVVEPCPNPDNCVQVSLVNVGPSSGQPGATLRLGLVFKQAPATVQIGGPDKVAALATTITLGTNAVGTPLSLADCNADSTGLPAAVKPTAALAGFKVVVENAQCANGDTHCLCPVGGQTQDNFLNLVVYAPAMLSAPPADPATVTPLPNGTLLTIDVTLNGPSGGTLPVHILNEVTDGGQPHTSTAALSISDTTAVDQTCLPLAQPGTPPCAASGSASQVAITDASVVIEATPTVTQTATESLTPLVSFTPTHTPQDSATPAATFTPTRTATSTQTLSATVTLTATPSTNSTPTTTSTWTTTATPTTSPTLSSTSPPTPTASGSQTVTPLTSPSLTATETHTAPATATGTATPTSTQTPIVECTPPPCSSGEVFYCPGSCPGGCGTQCATPTPPAPCVGDCTNMGHVTSVDVVTMTQIALGHAGVDACMLGDGSHDGHITVNEILTALNYAVAGCPH